MSTHNTLWFELQKGPQTRNEMYMYIIMLQIIIFSAYCKANIKRALWIICVCVHMNVCTASAPCIHLSDEKLHLLQSSR